MQAKVWALKFYKKYWEKKFSNLFVKVLISKIVELPTKDLSFIEIDSLITATPKK